MKLSLTIWFSVVAHGGRPSYEAHVICFISGLPLDTYVLSRNVRVELDRSARRSWTFRR